MREELRLVLSPVRFSAARVSSGDTYLVHRYYHDAAFF